MRLLRPGIAQPGGIWGDLGAGSGAFTLALAELLGAGGIIHAVDGTGGRWTSLRALRVAYPGVDLHLPSPISRRRCPCRRWMASSWPTRSTLSRQSGAVLAQVHGSLRAGGWLVEVEHNTDRGNRWVPFPFSFATWLSLARQAGFAHTELLATHPSSFLGESYAAASW